MWLILVAPTVWALQLITNINELCHKLSQESLKAVLASTKLDDIETFVGILASDYYDFQRPYDLINERVPRLRKLLEFVPRRVLHKNLFSLGKLGMNPFLARVLLNTPGYSACTETLQLNRFRLSERLKLVELLVAGLPGSIKSFRWQYSMLSERDSREDSLKIMLAAWDLLDFRQLADIPLGDDASGVEAVMEHWLRQQSNISRVLRIAKLINAAIFDIRIGQGIGESQRLALRLLKIFNHEWEQRSFFIHHDLEAWSLCMSNADTLMCHYEFADLCDAILELMEEEKEYKIHLLDLLVDLVMLVLSTVNDLTGFHNLLSMLDKASFRKAVMPAKLNLLCYLIFDHFEMPILCAPDPQMNAGVRVEWLKSSRVMLQSREQRQEINKKSNVFKEINRIFEKFAKDSIIMNMHFVEPVSIAPSHPETTSLRVLIFHLHHHILKNDLVFGWRGQVRCWRVMKQGYLMAYAQTLPYIISDGLQTDLGPVIPMSSAEVPHSESIDALPSRAQSYLRKTFMRHIQNQMCTPKNRDSTPEKFPSKLIAKALFPSLKNPIAAFGFSSLYERHHSPRFSQRPI